MLRRLARDGTTSEPHDREKLVGIVKLQDVTHVGDCLFVLPVIGLKNDAIGGRKKQRRGK